MKVKFVELMRSLRILSDVTPQYARHAKLGLALLENIARIERAISPEQKRVQHHPEWLALEKEQGVLNNRIVVEKIEPAKARELHSELIEKHPDGYKAQQESLSTELDFVPYQIGIDEMPTDIETTGDDLPVAFIITLRRLDIIKGFDNDAQ